MSARFAALLGTALASLAIGACTTTAPTPQTLASARLVTAQGVPVGIATIKAYDERLALDISASGLPPGAHGFHLHSTGRCAAPDFASAGGHLNPRGKTHGRLSPGGAHEGDLPNLAVSTSGQARAQYDIAGSRAEASEWIFDRDGTAIIIHAEPDDYRTDPSGNAGARLACGVLIKSGTRP